MLKTYVSPRARFIALSLEDSLLVVLSNPEATGHEGYGKDIQIGGASHDGFDKQCWQRGSGVTNK